MTRIIYPVAGVDLANSGIVVSSADGLMDLPKPRGRTAQEWTDTHGQMISTGRPLYSAREIKLSCAMPCEGLGDFAQKATAVKELFMGGDLITLTAAIGDTLLPFLVYVDDEISFTRKWAGGKLIASFTVKLCEPEPLKRVYKATAASVKLTITTPTPVNVYWGDGTTQYDAPSSTILHDYSDGKTSHIVIITGNINNLTSKMTNRNLLWSLL